MSRPADPALTAVAGVDLPGAVPLPAEPLDPSRWRALIAAVQGQRLVGQLARAVTAGMPVTDEQRREAAELHHAAMGQAIALERRLLALADAFDDAGVAHRVLKGSAVARLDYPFPEQRAFADLDILVPAGRLEAALDVADRLGYARYRPELRAGFDRRFAKSVTLAHPDGHELDLHRTLTLEPFGFTIDLPALFDGGALFTVGGRTLLALERELRFLHACYHAVCGAWPPETLALRDVAQILLAREGLDLDRVRDLARAWRAEAVVAHAVAAAWERLGLVAPHPLRDWAECYEPTEWERRALAVLHTPQRRQRERARVALGVLPPAERVAYLRALALPSGSFLRARDSGRLGWLRRARAAVGGGP